MIMFSLKNCQLRSVDQYDKDNLDYRAKKIKEDLEVHKHNYFYLGAHLLDLWTSGAYCASADKSVVYNLHQKVFFKYCEGTFDLEKSKVGRLINVVSEFGNELIGFKKEYEKYSYSLLTEMLSLTREQRKAVKHDWSVRQVREYKKNLNAKEDDIEGVVAEDKPKSDKYGRFEKYSKTDLCDLVIKLENEKLELEKELLIFRKVKPNPYMPKLAIN